MSFGLAEAQTHMALSGRQVEGERGREGARGAGVWAGHGRRQGR